MKAYEIWDDENQLSIGVLQYFDKEQRYIIELQDNLDEWTAPLLFTNYVKRGIYTIPRQESYLWVKERVIPSGRQNIDDILRNHKMAAYDEMRILELARGKCSQDSMSIKKIDRLPSFVVERQKKNLVDCCMCDHYVVLCFFADHVVKKLALEQLKDVSGIDKVMQNQLLFESGMVGTGGYCLTFNDSIDIPAKFLYDVRNEMPIESMDFETYVQKNIWDTTQVCDALSCTRQNLSYMLRKESLSPLKTDVKGNLYMKGDVLKNKW